MTHLDEGYFENIEPEWHRTTVARAFNGRTFDSVAGQLSVRVASLEELIASVRSSQRILGRATLDIEHITMDEEAYDEEEENADYGGPAHREEEKLWEQLTLALKNVDLEDNAAVAEVMREFFDSIIEERAGLDPPRLHGAYSFIIAERRVVEEVLATLTDAE